MSDSEYTPPKIWRWDIADAEKLTSLNRPSSGARYEQELPVGKHPLQLYSLATPNGIKVTIMLEELLALGIREAEYDAWLINIMQAEQFSSGFVALNPNSKIPVLCDHSEATPLRVFESGAILLYLAERFSQFLPTERRARTECLNWLFWQMGSAPYIGGGFGHFYHYAPVKIKYAIDRFSLETKRLLDVLDKHLAKNRYCAGEEYSIADMATYPWYGQLVMENMYQGQAFLEVKEYRHVRRWATEIGERTAVKRGLLVNKAWGEKQLPERHDSQDIDHILV